MPTTWATSTDFTNRYDSRVVAQLSNDTNSTSANSLIIAALLADAASEIRAACLRGGIYTTDQLDALNNSGDTQLVRLNCDVAIKLLAKRRVGDIPQAVKDIVRRTEEFLDALRTGKKVLNISTNRAADLPAMVNTTGDQRYNLGDLTINEFWSDQYGTNSTSGRGT
jgi:phage gp36-like protein